jgi:formate dehydrogenase iron-sulfur subunit
MKVYVPNDSTALSLGAEDVVSRLREIEPDLEIHRNGSRGLAWLEPLIEVESHNGRIAYGPVTAESLSKAMLQGKSHELLLGDIEQHPYLAKQQRLTFERIGKIDPENLADYQKMGGFDGLRRAIASPPQAIVDQVKASGLRGRGGAAFPTGRKWQTVLETSSDKKYIVCNADEGDSGTFADRLLMECDPFCLIEGMVIAAIAVGANQGYIYLRREYPLALERLQAAIDKSRKAGFLGKHILGSDYCFELEVRLGADAYICGEETSLLESLEGKRGLVRSKPPLPAIEGLFGRPTVVNNVLTLATIPFILARGAEEYANYGTGDSRGTITIQLAGNIVRGGLVELAFGTTLRELLVEFGNGSFSGRELKAVQVGGPLGAYLPASKWDLPLDYEAFTAAGAMLGHGGIVAFDDTVDMAQQAEFSMEFCALESCGKCTPCRIGSVRGAEVLARIRQGQQIEKGLELLEDICETMEKGSLCAMGGLTPFPVRSAINYFPEDFQPVEVK